MEGRLVRSLPFKVMAIDLKFHLFTHHHSLRPAPRSEWQGCGQSLENLPVRKLPETLRQGAKGHMLDQTSGAGTLQRCWERRHCPRPWGIIVHVPGAPLSVSRAPCTRVDSACLGCDSPHPGVAVQTGVGVATDPTLCHSPRCCCGRPTRCLRS